MVSPRGRDSLGFGGLKAIPALIAGIREDQGRPRHYPFLAGSGSGTDVELRLLLIGRGLVSVLGFKAAMSTFRCMGFRI